MSTPVPPPGARPARFATPGRELVVVARPEAGLRASGVSVASAANAGIDVSALGDALRRAGASIHPLFGSSEAAVRNATAPVAAARPAAHLPDLALFYRVSAPDAALDALARELHRHAAVESAYVKPGAVPALMYQTDPTTAAAPSVTPDFTPLQGYLNRAPDGIDARYAWLKPGGQGGNMRIIDVEYAWRFTHEDLRQAQGGVTWGVPPDVLDYRQHGTGVIGVFSGDRNAYGVTGTCPSAVVSAASISLDGTLRNVSVARAILAAADGLFPGDVLLIELHAAGPRYRFQQFLETQLGFIPVEWWPDNLAAILHATARGVVVVEAAGNGSENLDDALYDVNPPEPYGPFPFWWANPFRRTVQDPGAILVGAGAPPPGTHGNFSMGPDRSRLDFSNHGSCVDAQGWGLEVTTCGSGSGDLQRGPDEDRWYMNGFNGTSSAAPIVTGAAACLQGALRGAGRAPLTPAEMRTMLRATGSPQQDAPGRPASQRIGSRPDLRQMIDRLLAPGAAVPLYRYYNATAVDHFYTTNFAELQTGRGGYAYEGEQCAVYAEQKPGTVALHRYYNAVAADHLYTTTPAELEPDAHGYAYEGVQCWVLERPQPGTVPLFRYYNASSVDHFYTTAWHELGWGVLGSWVFERTQCHVFPSPVAAAAAPRATADATAAAAEPVGAV